MDDGNVGFRVETSNRFLANTSAVKRLELNVVKTTNNTLLICIVDRRNLCSSQVIKIVSQQFRPFNQQDGGKHCGLDEQQGRQKKEVIRSLAPCHGAIETRHRRVTAI